MTLQQILDAIIRESQVLGPLLKYLLIAAGLYFLKQLIDAIKRIPPKEWFDKVGDDLARLASDHVLIETHTGAIAQLEQRAEDHESRLSRLQGQHEARTGTHCAPGDC